MRRITATCAALVASLFASAAWAQQTSASTDTSPIGPNNLPEPGSVPLVILAVVGAVGVARYLKNRKK